MSRLRVGVIGAGPMAGRHLEVLAAFQDVNVVSITNRGHERVYGLAGRFGVRRTFSDYRRMLDEVPMDAAFALVSPSSMTEVGAECLRRGIPTLLEKPPGLSARETKGLLDIANAAGCLNMVGLNRRFYSVMRRARETIMEAGPLVSILVDAPEPLAEVEPSSTPFSPASRRHLFVKDIHCIDLLRYFAGDVAHVHAVSGRWFQEQKDSYGALIRFQDGAMGHYVANWMSPGFWSVHLYGRGLRVCIRPLEQGTIVEGDGREIQISVDEVDLRYKAGLYAQDRYFLDCVKSGRPVAYPASDLGDAVKTMKLIEAIEAGQMGSTAAKTWREA